MEDMNNITRQKGPSKEKRQIAGKYLQAVLPDPLIRRLRAQAALEGVSPSLIVQRSLEASLTVQEAA